jgi:hypothetical protein
VERHGDDGVFRDAQGNLRLGIVLRMHGGPLSQPGLLTALAPTEAPVDPRVARAQRGDETAVGERAAWLRVGALVVGGVALLAAVALSAWWYLRRRLRHA